MKRLITFIFTLLTLHTLCAQERRKGDIFTENGITYKVVGEFLTIDAKDTKDAKEGIAGPESFHWAGDALVIAVDEINKDVIIPPHVGRLKVIGLTDSLFYGKTINRIWLPRDLKIIGRSAFENARINSGMMIVHNVESYYKNCFKNLDAGVCFDVTKDIDPNNKNSKLKEHICEPTGGFYASTSCLKYLKPIRNYLMTARSKNYDEWIDKAYQKDEDWKALRLSFEGSEAASAKRSFRTMPTSSKKYMNISIGLADVSKLYADTLAAGEKNRFYYGLTARYEEIAIYSVYNKSKKRGVTTKYKEQMTPVSNPALKEGWHLEFTNKGYVDKFQLTGKPVKEKK